MYKKIRQKPPLVLYRNVLVEKHIKGVGRKVVIRKSTRKKFWYSIHIGEIFVVREFSGIQDFRNNLACSSMPDKIVMHECKTSFLLVGGERCIKKTDCDVIK